VLSVYRMKFLQYIHEASISFQLIQHLVALKSLDSAADMKKHWDSLQLVLDNQTKQWVLVLMTEGLLFSFFTHLFISKEMDVWDLWQNICPFLTVALKSPFFKDLSMLSKFQVCVLIMFICLLILSVILFFHFY
jgi:hypothetical protein